MNEKLINNCFYQDYIRTTEEFEKFSNECIPLCAAENIMSPFAKKPLTSDAQEKYVMGGLLDVCKEDNFIGSEKIYPYYQIIQKQCRKIFCAEYADSRTLTGMNSITTLLMSLTKIGDTVAISSPDCGGHASIPDICRRLGLKTIDIPYSYDKLDFDYVEINKMLLRKHISAVLICISDVVNVPNFSIISNPHNIPIIYDATQTLGLIAGNVLENPLICQKDYDNFIMMGATHKTLPGPSCSLIMTNNIKLANIIEKKINPMYIRNTQMHQVMSLIYTLLEIENFGEEYAKRTIENAQILSEKLCKNGINVLNQEQGFTSTHQLFIHCPEETMMSFYENCEYYNITLNFKTKKLFGYSGIRIGTQAISRYNWKTEEINLISEILIILYNNPKAYLNNNLNRIIKGKIKKLQDKKEIFFTFV